MAVRPRPSPVSQHAGGLDPTRARLLHQLGFTVPPQTTPASIASITNTTTTNGAAAFLAKAAVANPIERASTGRRPRSSQAIIGTPPEEGVEKDSTNSHGSNRIIQQHYQPRTSVLGDSYETYTVPLNDDHDDHIDADESSSSAHTTSSLFQVASALLASSPSTITTTPQDQEEPPKPPPPPPPQEQQQRHVQFSKCVHVVSIPSRHDYSDRMQDCLWTRKVYLKELVQNNYIEFEYEDFCVENVVEESEMTWNPHTQSWIHPCHPIPPPAPIPPSNENHNNHTNEGRPSLRRTKQVFVSI